MISDYMQAIKTRADELATLGIPLGHEDLIEKILEGLLMMITNPLLTLSIAMILDLL